MGKAHIKDVRIPPHHFCQPRVARPKHDVKIGEAGVLSVLYAHADGASSMHLRAALRSPTRAFGFRVWPGSRMRCNNII